MNKQQRNNIETFGLAQLQDRAASAASMWARVEQEDMFTDEQPLCGDMYTRAMHDATGTTPAQHTRNSLWGMVKAK